MGDMARVRRGNMSGIRVAFSTAAAICGIGVASSVWFGSTSASAAESCPNEARRLEQAVTLPECRAYEMVTPVVKGSGEPQPIDLGEIREGRELEPLRPSGLYGAAGARAAVDGDRMAWVSEPMPASLAPGVSQMSIRTADGWRSEGLVPPMSPLNDLGCPLVLGVSGWSKDLTKAVLDLPAGPPRGFLEERECGHDEPRLVAGEPEHFRNLFVRDNVTGTHALVNVTPSSVVWPASEPSPDVPTPHYWPASLLAASDDLSHVVFEEELALTPDAPGSYPGNDELYEWTGGEVRLVTVLPDPDGTPVHGSLAGATRNYSAASGDVADGGVNIAQFRHAVSADGSRIFFEAPGDEGEGDLYMRQDGAVTVQIDAAEPGAPGAGGGGDFQWASADGSRVVFTSENRLTADSTAASGEPDLYEYDLQAADLTDLTVGAGEPGNVLGVGAASDDASDVYFVAMGELAAGLNSEGDGAIPGQPNLYLAREGGLRFIATLDPESDQCDWAVAATCNGDLGKSGITSRGSGDGRFLAFNSVRSLTGYDNTSPSSGEPVVEIFLYDAAEDRLSCASCHPQGAAMTSGAAIKFPAGPGLYSFWHNRYPQRNLSDRGQVFFETADALLPRDVNGRRDVYMYSGGALHLISTGKGESGSHFLDATPDGGSVFFSTGQRLLPRDDDTVYDYYVARVDGGFAEPPPPPPPCGAGPCRGPGTSAPDALPPGTSPFSGRGNVGAHRRCAGIGRRAHKLSNRAKRLRRHGKRAKRNGKSAIAKKRNHKATRLAKRARNKSKSAKRCRRANRRAAK